MLLRTRMVQDGPEALPVKLFVSYQIKPSLFYILTFQTFHSTKDLTVAKETCLAFRINKIFTCKHSQMKQFSTFECFIQHFIDVIRM